MVGHRHRLAFGRLDYWRGDAPARSGRRNARLASTEAQPVTAYVRGLGAAVRGLDRATEALDSFSCESPKNGPPIAPMVCRDRPAGVWQNDRYRAIRAGLPT